MRQVPLSSRKLSEILAVALVGIAMCACGNVSSNGGESGRIVFASDRDGDFDIYVMDVDGSNHMRLTDHPAHDYGPVWSPDGTQIAFISERNCEFGGSNLYLMDADGTNPAPLSRCPARHLSPTWSPDGARVAFQAEQYANSVIFMIDIASSNATWMTLTDSPDFSPSWSPDGRRIAVVSSNSSGSDLYIANADGTGVVQLTDDTESNSAPAWSPDGSRIVYDAMTLSDAARNVYANPNIYVVDTDGSNRLQLTFDGHSLGPSWSPDGSRIIFTSDRDGDFDLYMMNADGSNVVQLTDEPGADMDPTWRP